MPGPPEDINPPGRAGPPLRARGRTLLIALAVLFGRVKWRDQVGTLSDSASPFSFAYDEVGSLRGSTIYRNRTGDVAFFFDDRGPV